MLIPIQFSKDFNYLKSLTYVHCNNLNFPTNSKIEPSHTIFYPYNITETQIDTIMKPEMQIVWNPCLVDISLLIIVFALGYQKS